MKKFFVAMVLLCSVLFASMAMSEGVKRVELAPGISVMVPEEAPDFHKFIGGIIDAKKYENGNIAAIAQAVNEEQTVLAVMVLAKISGQVYIVAAQVIYIRDPLSPHSEFLEDMQFMKTGKPSGVLSYVKNPTDFNIFETYIASTHI